MADPRLEVLERTYVSARRGDALKRWGLKNRMTPIDSDSSLAADDANFMPDYAGSPVSGAVLFPAMNATDALASVADLIAYRPKSKNSHITSIVALCRVAAESASRTIWMLSPTEREIRRSRCARFEHDELNKQLSFHQSEHEWFDAHPEQKQRQQYADLTEHIRLHKQRKDMLAAGMQATPKQKVPGYTDVISVAAQWMSDNPPAHDREPYTELFPDIATRFYRLSSGFVHGYKWGIDYVQNGEVDTFRMAAEGLAIAVGMAECAVALYESQAQRYGSASNRMSYYPPSLTKSVRGYAALYYT